MSNDDPRKPKPGNSLSGVEKYFVSKKNGGKTCLVTVIGTAVTVVGAASRMRGWW